VDEDGGWQTIDVPADFGSAVETGFEDLAAEGKLPDELKGLVAIPSADTDVAVSTRPGGRFGVRPVLGVQGILPAGTAGAWGGSAGGRFFHQWWTLADKTLRPAGETRLSASGLFGGVWASSSPSTLQLALGWGRWVCSLAAAVASTSGGKTARSGLRRRSEWAG
jgi:hypothetical protein